MNPDHLNLQKTKKDCPYCGWHLYRVPSTGYGSKPLTKEQVKQKKLIWYWCEMCDEQYSLLELDKRRESHVKKQ